MARAGFSSPANRERDPRNDNFIAGPRNTIDNAAVNGCHYELLGNRDPKGAHIGPIGSAKLFVDSTRAKARSVVPLTRRRYSGKRALHVAQDIDDQIAPFRSVIIRQPLFEQTKRVNQVKRSWRMVQEITLLNRVGATDRISRSLTHSIPRRWAPQFLRTMQRSRFKRKRTLSSSRVAEKSCR